MNSSEIYDENIIVVPTPECPSSLLQPMHEYRVYDIEDGLVYLFEKAGGQGYPANLFLQVIKKGNHISYMPLVQYPTAEV